MVLQAARKNNNEHPTFMFAGIRGKRVCRKHAVAGMVPVYRTRCAHDNCSKGQSFGTKKSEAAFSVPSMPWKGW